MKRTNFMALALLVATASVSASEVPAAVVEAPAAVVEATASVAETVASVATTELTSATGMLETLKAQALAAKSGIANGVSSAFSTVANSKVVTGTGELVNSGVTAAKNGFSVSKEFVTTTASSACDFSKTSWASLVASVKGGSTNSLNALNNGYVAVKTFAVENPYKTTAIAAGVVVTTVAAYKLISNYFAKKNTDNAQAA